MPGKNQTIDDILRRIKRLLASHDAGELDTHRFAWRILELDKIKQMDLLEVQYPELDDLGGAAMDMLSPEYPSYPQWLVDRIWHQFRTALAELEAAARERSQ